MNHLEKKFCNAFEECTLKVAFCALLSFLLNNIKLMQFSLRQDTVRKILRANCIHALLKPSDLYDYYDQLYSFSE